jgi:hypothetical protein
MPTNEGKLKKEVQIEHKPSKDLLARQSAGLLD